MLRFRIHQARTRRRSGVKTIPSAVSGQSDDALNELMDLLGLQAMLKGLPLDLAHLCLGREPVRSVGPEIASSQDVLYSETHCLSFEV